MHGSVTRQEKKYKVLVLTEEKLEDTGTRHEHSPRKSLKNLAQEIEVLKSNARTATQLLKLRPYKTTVIHSRLATAQFS
jgi:hypothetical protein